MINVLIVDDSEFCRRQWRKLLSTDPEIQVVGGVPSGLAALWFLEHLLPGQKPNVVIMDTMMPEMDGFEATRKIMVTHPLPIVITADPDDPHYEENALRALDAGAVTILQKPDKMIVKHEFETVCKNMIGIIKLMAGVKVVRRRPRDNVSKVSTSPGLPPTIPTTSTTRTAIAESSHPNIRILAVGASTGGTVALQHILLLLSKKLPIPIMVVQHIGGEFIASMIQWLEKTTGFPVHLAQAGQKMLPGHVYLSPDDFHLAVQPGDVIKLSHAEKVDGLRPSISYLFQSVAQVYKEKAIGVLLTGMGKDGGLGLKEMRDAGAVTIAQDKRTSAVFGMPAEAIKLGGATYILPLKEIPIKIHQLLGLEPHTDNDI